MRTIYAMLKVGGRMKLSLKAVILVRLTNLRSVYMLLARPVFWTVMSEIFHTNWTQINEIILFSVENKLIFWLVYWRPIGRDIFLSDKNVLMFVQSLKFRMIWVINLLLIYLFCLPNHTWEAEPQSTTFTFPVIDSKSKFCIKSSLENEFGEIPRLESILFQVTMTGPCEFTGPD